MSSRAVDRPVGSLALVGAASSAWRSGAIPRRRPRAGGRSAWAGSSRTPGPGRGALRQQLARRARSGPCLRAVTDVDPMEGVARVAEEPLVLLEPLVEGLEVEHHVGGEVRVRGPERRLVAHLPVHAQVRGLALGRMRRERDPGMQDRRAPASAGGRPARARRGRRRPGWHRWARRAAAPRRASRGCCRRPGGLPIRALTRFSVGSARSSANPARIRSRTRVLTRPSLPERSRSCRGG